MNVQCNAGGILWCSSVIWGRYLSHWGFGSHSGSVSWARVALNTSCNSAFSRAVLFTPGWASASIHLVFSSISAFLKWAGKVLRDELFSFTYRVRATARTVTWSPCSLGKEARILLPSEFRQFKFPSVKANHTTPLVKESPVICGQSRAAPKCSLKESLFFPRRQGESTGIMPPAQERSILPQSFLPFVTFPPALMTAGMNVLLWTEWTKWKLVRQETGEREQDHGAMFYISPAGSL